MSINTFFNKEAKDYTEKIYSNRGSRYVTLLEENYLKEWLSRLFKKTDKIVEYDMGIGNGRMSQIVQNYFNQQASIYGVDFSADMINRTSGLVKVKQFYNHDLNKKFTQPINEKADLVISFRVFKYVENIVNLVDALDLITKKGGYLILQFANRNSFNVLLKFLSRFKSNNDRSVYVDSLRFYSLKRIISEFGNRFDLIDYWGNIRLPYFLFNWLGQCRIVSCLISAEKFLNWILPKAFLSRDIVVVLRKNDKETAQ